MKDRRVPLDMTTPCEFWTGTVRTHGYGVVMVDTVEKYVHRLAYQLHVGPIPRGWEIDHVCHTEAVKCGECAGGESCRHRRCFNPAHLEAVSSRENTIRGNHPLITVARQRVCKRGHDQTDPQNVYIRPDGRSRCRVCQIETQRDRRAAANGGTR